MSVEAVDRKWAICQWNNSPLLDPLWDLY